MSLTLSDYVCTTFVGGLATLQSLLDAAESHANAKSVAVTGLLEARLADDMFSFTQQVQTATDNARRVTDRLRGAEPSSMPDPQPSIAGLTQRVSETREHVLAADRAAIDATTERTMKVELGPGLMDFTGRSYVLGFGVPNFLFHVTTAYDILRQQGVKLDKATYIKPFMVACSR